MNAPLMPKATAVWLVENTALSFIQIAHFCNLHELEVQAIADGDVATGMQGLDPVASHVLTREEIDRCQADPRARLKPLTSDLPSPKKRQGGARYTPVSKRQDRPDAIAWLVKNYPELTDGQVSKMVGTTKPTINAIRERTHWNISNIKPQNPVGLGLCSEQDLQKAVERARRRVVNAEKRAEKAKRDAAREAGEPLPEAAPAAPFPVAADDAPPTATDAPFPADPDAASAPVGESVVESTHGEAGTYLVNAAVAGHSEKPLEERDHTVESVFGAPTQPADDKGSTED